MSKSGGTLECGSLNIIFFRINITRFRLLQTVCAHISAVTNMKLFVIFVVGLLAYLTVARVCDAAVDDEISDRSPESLDDTQSSDRPIGPHNNQEPKRKTSHATQGH